jgi:hypothetical protein
MSEIVTLLATSIAQPGRTEGSAKWFFVRLGDSNLCGLGLIRDIKIKVRRTYRQT